MSRFNPHHSNAPQVFEAAELFKNRCLLEQKSLLLDQERLWTPEHFAALIENYVKRPDEGQATFYEKLEGQLRTCQPLDVALMTEVFWIVQLGPINLLPETKLNALKRIWNIKPAAPFPTQSALLTVPVLSGLGSAGPGYNQYMWAEMVYAVEAFADFVAKDRNERSSLLADSTAFATWLDSIPSGRGRQLYHVLCHVLFPDAFERIFSQGHKNRVARAHHIWRRELGEDRPRMDVQLRELRERLEREHATSVDYYYPPVGTLMKEEKTEAAASNVASTVVSGVKEPGVEYDGDSTNIRPTLRIANNLILFGPPGTSKTHKMQELMEQAFNAGQDYEFVCFHPSYSYEDFVGGLRPIGNGAVGFQKGPFVRLCEKAHANPTLRFTLFIDEINRANVAKVFGELITLIEPSKRVIAGSKPQETGAWMTLPGLSERFGVPDNLDIVASMNTADRSIALIDVALRRRFRFQECPPDPELLKNPFVGAVDLRKLMQCLNDRLEYLLDRDHLIGHAVFMEIGSLQDLQRVIAQKVIPLLQEYFFEDMEKVRLVLTGSSGESAFFKLRKLSPETLFPQGRRIIGDDARLAFSVTDPQFWHEEDFLRLYGGTPAIPAETDVREAIEPSTVGA